MPEPTTHADAARHAPHPSAVAATAALAARASARDGYPAVLPGGIDNPHRWVLQLDKISVSFDGFRALNDLSLSIEVGELRCVIGPNGAGKTTMMDVITGKTRPDEGRAFFNGTVDLLQHNEPEIASFIGRKFQKPTVFVNHTVLENLELAGLPDKRVWPTLVKKIGAAERERIDATLDTIGLAEHAAVAAGALSHGQKQWLEIGMLLMQNPRVLLVDEPVAGMTKQEVETTAELLTSLAGEHSVVVVEHDMEFVRSIANKVTVLHQGHVLAEGPMAQIQADPRVIEVYLGA
jgi:urea transport system ATP-binding protein